MTGLERVSHEAMVFMRGKYRLDEAGNGKDELKFKQGKKTILTVYIREGRFDFMIIFGKGEREAFEERRKEFSPWVQEVYDSAKTYHDGKWMMFGIDSLERLEALYWAERGAAGDGDTPAYQGIWADRLVHALRRVRERYLPLQGRALPCQELRG